jgi:hypothetical protein
VIGLNRTAGRSLRFRLQTLNRGSEPLPWQESWKANGAGKPTKGAGQAPRGNNTEKQKSLRRFEKKPR